MLNLETFQKSTDQVTGQVLDQASLLKHRPLNLPFWNPSLRLRRNIASSLCDVL